MQTAAVEVKAKDAATALAAVEQEVEAAQRQLAWQLRVLSQVGTSGAGK